MRPRAYYTYIYLFIYLFIYLYILQLGLSSVTSGIIRAKQKGPLNISQALYFYFRSDHVQSW